MAKLGEAYVVIRAALKPLRRGLTAARKAVTASMRKIGRVIKRAMLLGVVAIGYAIKAAADFQKQLAMVSTMLSEKTMPVMNIYKNTIVKLAKKFGQATKTLAKGLYDILSASIAVEKATGVLRAAAKAAIAGMTETEVAADAITTIINSYAMDAERAGEISDKLFATVKRGKLTFEELASSIGRAAPTAAIAGMRLEELLAVIATITRAGINAHEAMTSVSGVLRAFLKPTTDAIKAAAEFGVELSSATLRGKGFVGAVKLLTKASAEQLAMIVPNIRAFKGLAASLKDVEGVTYDLNFITNRFAGEADTAYRKMAETASFRLGRVKQQFIATFRALGEPLLKPFLRLSDRVSETLESMETWFNENEETITEWGDIVVDKIEQVAAYFGNLARMIEKGETQEAYKKLTDDIIKITKDLWERLRVAVIPPAVEIGSAMGRGILAGLRKEFPAITEMIKHPFRAVARTTPAGLAYTAYQAMTVPRPIRAKAISPAAAEMTAAQVGGGRTGEDILRELQQINRNTRATVE